MPRSRGAAQAGRVTLTGLDGELLLIVRQSRRILRRPATPPGTHSERSLWRTAQNWLAQRVRDLHAHPHDNPLPILRGYPYGPRI